MIYSFANTIVTRFICVMLTCCHVEVIKLCNLEFQYIWKKNRKHAPLKF